MRQPKQHPGSATPAIKRRARGRRRSLRPGRMNSNENSLNWRMQHHPLDDGKPALSRVQIPGAETGGPPSYPMRAADTVDALEKKGRIDHRAAAAARKFEATFQWASLQGLACRDLAQLPGGRGSNGGGGSGGEPNSILRSRDQIWAAMGALGGMGTPGANIVWDVLGLGMTIKGHAERCQFGGGRSLNPMTATGILVQSCFSLAVYYGK